MRFIADYFLPGMFPKKFNSTGSAVSCIWDVQYFELVFITSNSLLENTISKKKKKIGFLMFV